MSDIETSREFAYALNIGLYHPDKEEAHLQAQHGEIQHLDKQGRHLPPQHQVSITKPSTVLVCNLRT